MEKVKLNLKDKKNNTYTQALNSYSHKVCMYKTCFCILGSLGGRGGCCIVTWEQFKKKKKFQEPRAMEEELPQRWEQLVESVERMLPEARRIYIGPADEKFVIDLHSGQLSRKYIFY